METINKVKERPILFSTAMVQAILEGRKTVTRRVIKESFNGCLTNGGPHPCPNDPAVIYPGETYESPCHPGESITVDWPEVRAVFHCSALDVDAKCPYGKPGDILWVRETFFKNGDEYIYLADGTCCEQFEGKPKWKPSIFMPRAACRIRLEIQCIGVERLQDITEEDAIREGIELVDKKLHGGELRTMYKDYMHKDHVKYSPVRSFKSLWQSINGADSWDAKPWVWKIEFKMV
jgi:hypothetical protein